MTLQIGYIAVRYGVRKFDSHLSVHRHDSIGFGQVKKGPWRRPAPARASFYCTNIFQKITAQMKRCACLVWRLP